MYIGAPADAEPRIAKLVQVEVAPETRAAFEALMGEDSLWRRTAPADEGLNDLIDSPEGHASEIPAISGVMTARDLARLYACLANYGEIDGARLLSERTVRTMSEQLTLRPDRVLMGMQIGWAMGYMTGGSPGWPQGTRVTAFGHAGLGGSVGVADPEINFSFGFVPNKMAMDLIGYGRTAALADAARTCAEAAG
jgi:CubicO group peptidase (beta-lactamase class C family)